MSATATAIVTAWLAIAVIGVVVMGRRGHDRFSWAIVFAFLGPLAVPVAIGADRHRPPEEPCPPRSGNLDVLVADDASEPGCEALDTALKLLGEQMTSLTLAAVVDVEAATTVRGRETEQEARQRLAARVGAVAGGTHAPVDTVVLHGDPAHALERYAAENGYELIVVGCRGKVGPRVRRSKVARSLLAGSSVPVLVAPSAR